MHFYDKSQCSMYTDHFCWCALYDYKVWYDSQQRYAIGNLPKGIVWCNFLTNCLVERCISLVRRLPDVKLPSRACRIAVSCHLEKIKRILWKLFDCVCSYSHQGKGRWRRSAAGRHRQGQSQVQPPCLCRKDSWKRFGILRWGTGRPNLWKKRNFLLCVIPHIYQRATSSLQTCKKSGSKCTLRRVIAHRLTVITHFCMKQISHFW